MLSTDTKSRHNQAKYFQAGGALPHYVDQVQASLATFLVAYGV